MSRNKLGWVIGLCTVALLVVVGLPFLHPSSPVPAGASRVPGTRGGFNLSSPWRSGHEVFVYDSGSGGSLVDVATGAKTPVANFGNYGRLYMDAIRFSPDGKWLLWATGTDASPIYMATQVPAGRTVQRPRPPQPDRYQAPGFAWLRDSKRWVEEFTENGQSYARVYSVDTPRVEKVPTASLASLETPATQTSNGASLPLYSPQAQVAERVASPDGGKVAWFTTVNDDSLDFPYFLGSFARLGRVPHGQIQRHRVGLWVSNADGSSARRVVPDFVSESTPVNLCWAPDGRHLSFYYALNGPDGLWTVPVS